MSHPQAEQHKEAVRQAAQAESTVEGRAKATILKMIAHARSLPAADIPAALDDVEANIDDIAKGIAHGPQ